MNGAAKGRITGMNDASFMPQSEGAAPVRPSWSISEAARRTGKSRATIGRHLAKGAFPDAVQTDQGWSIPLDNLLAAGFTPDRPAPPDPAPEVVQQQVEQLRAADALAQRAQAAEQALAEVQRALEQERAERLIAQAVANERAEQITDLRRAVAALEAARPAPPPTQQEQSAPPADPVPVSVQHQRRGRLGRALANLVDRGR